ncbi:hypothetical protein EDB85DRAFT_1899234 [Lactarius pseudohatsudake]|nr:hypothetical protein EDB85DRAFT_1899234 [Lactarius pseudohatsudake]
MVTGAKNDNHTLSSCCCFTGGGGAKEGEGRARKRVKKKTVCDLDRQASCARGAGAAREESTTSPAGSVVQQLGNVKWIMRDWRSRAVDYIPLRGRRGGRDRSRRGSLMEGLLNTCDTVIPVDRFQSLEKGEPSWPVLHREVIQRNSELSRKQDLRICNPGPTQDSLGGGGIVTVKEDRFKTEEENLLLSETRQSCTPQNGQVFKRQHSKKLPRGGLRYQPPWRERVTVSWSWGSELRRQR